MKKYITYITLGFLAVLLSSGLVLKRQSHLFYSQVYFNEAPEFQGGGTFTGDVDFGDYDLTSVDKVEGFDPGLFIDMGQNSQILFSADGAGTAFATPDLDFTGSSFFDDSMGIGTTKQIQFYDADLWIGASADGKLKLSSNGASTDDITLSGTVTGDADWVNTGAIEGGTVTDGTFTSTAGAVSAVASLEILDATPSVELTDSDTTDNDVNAQLLVAATATGTGAEEVDVSLLQQQAGTLTAFLTSDADGNMTLDSGAGNIIFTDNSYPENAAPGYELKDNDCTDADVNASIVAAATGTGTGAEEVDVVLSQQQAGALTAFLTADADGNLDLDSGAGIVSSLDSFGVANAAPQYSFYDTDATDGDVNASIIGQCSAVGTGAENCDVNFAQQQAGTPADFLVADADGNITIDAFANIDLVDKVVTVQEFTYHLGYLDFMYAPSGVTHIPAEAAAHPTAANESIWASASIMPFNQFGGTIVCDQITAYYNTDANGDDFDFNLISTDVDGSVTVLENHVDIGNGTSGAQNTTLLAADITLLDFAYHVELDVNNAGAATDVKIYDIKFECHLE